MPADNTLPQTSAHHRDGSAPYPCHTAKTPPGAAWAIATGYCRTSLDWHDHGNPQGQGDPRCPSSCPHKAPQAVAVKFSKIFTWQGAAAAAHMAREHRAKRKR